MIYTHKLLFIVTFFVSSFIGLNYNVYAKHRIIGEFEKASIDECYKAIENGKKLADDRNAQITVSGIYYYKSKLFKITLEKVTMGHQGYKRIACYRFLPNERQPNSKHNDQD